MTIETMTIKQDSRDADINELVNGINDMTIHIQSSVMKKWVKEIDFDKSIKMTDYNRKEYFKPIMDIVLDNDMKNGNKKRMTLIKFEPTISIEEYNSKTEWLYIFVIDGRIVKIGGTRTGIKGRVASYLCGHHVEERGKSGDCSKTNGFIYNTFEFYLNLGCKIQMYGYQLPQITTVIDIFNEEVKVISQTFHVYESKFLDDFKKNYNVYPVLSDNCDPNYRA
jgi:hypothetical protein